MDITNKMKAKSGVKKGSYDTEQVKMGLECEAPHMIHGLSKAQIMGIIHDHLDEDQEYYTHLEAMEEANEKEEPEEDDEKETE
jgi:hypothetical protein